MKEFSEKNVYQNLILKLNQLKQGALKSVRKYKEKKLTLQNKLQRCFKVQGHEGIDPVFVKINALVLEHFTINLSLDL
jgi:hypothetical protein